MRVALFVPCFVDQFHPEVAFACLDLLKSLGVSVEVPPDQTCCGQPLVNLGASLAARPVALRFCELFSGYDCVVAPSASCTSMVRQFAPLGLAEPRFEVFDLCEFIVDRLGVQRVAASFPHRVAVHPGCHGLRELGLGPTSERPQVPRLDRIRQLLATVSGLELVSFDRADECCGFGGTFALTEADVSRAMGEDKLDSLERAGAEFVTSGDMSCLMHLDSLLSTRNSRLRVMHVAQVLAGHSPTPAEP